MIFWLLRCFARKKEQAQQLQQKQVEERIAAFDAPSRPYVLLMFRTHIRLLQVNLERAGLETRIAATNAEALAVMQIALPSVLVCYTGNPRSHEAKLIEEVRHTPNLAEISIVVVSQSQQENTTLPEMKRLGATECFSIPFMPQEFVSAVRRLMPSSA